MAHGRTHRREFQLDVVRQVASGEKHPAQVCRVYGLAKSLLLRWRKEYNARGEAAFGFPAELGPQGLEQRVAEVEHPCRSRSSTR
jgi:transposase